MAERFRSDLPYGQFGRGTYSQNDCAWQHARRIEQPSWITSLGDLKPLATSSANPQFHLPASGSGAKQRKQHEQQIKAILRSNPELQITSGLIPGHLRASELARDAAQTYDFTKGSLISVTNIHSQSRHRTIQVAAYVTGENGADLLFGRVQLQKQWWTDNDDFWLDVPTIRGEQMILPGKGAPILQVRFGTSVEPGSAILGLRMHDKIALFHPTHQKVSPDTLSGSRLSLNPLHDIEIEEPNGISYADFAFNPWFFQQIAVIDRAGHWKVLEFRTRKMDSVARRWAGSSLDESTSLTDGWARISWITNIGLIAICTRTTLKLVSISADEAVVAEHVGVELSGAIPWILGFAVVPERPNYFIVLTTTHVALYEAKDEIPTGAMTCLVSKIRHFRGPEDTTLTLTTWKEDKGIVVALRSSLLRTMICYRIDFSAEPRVVLDDPFESDLPTAIERSGPPHRLPDIFVQPVKMMRRPGARPSESAAPSPRFLAASIISGNGDASECLLHTVGIAKRPSDGALLPPDRLKKLNVTTSQLASTGFIVDDAVVEIEEEDMCRREPLARRRRRHKPHLAPMERTIDLERVGRLLQEPVEGAQPFDNVLDSLSSFSRKWRNRDPPSLRTLTGFSNLELAIEDVGTSSEAFQRLVRSHFDKSGSPLVDDDGLEQFSQQRLALETLNLPYVLNLSEQLRQSELSTVYDEIVRSWITSLSANVSGRVRLAKARMASSIAVDLMLACNVLRVEETGHEISTDRHFGVGHSQEPGSSQAILSQQTSALPTPSITPSMTTASSHPSSFAAPELIRLSKYTTFSKPVPTILPRSLNRVLAHWRPGTQPDDYDWMSTSRNLTQKDDEEEDEEMPERERKRLQRRAERHIRRQRKEAAASEAMQLASSQAPAIFSASQPMAVQVESQPNAVAESSQMTIRGGPFAGATSQVVAGRYGGRPPAKKKRKQGF